MSRCSTLAFTAGFMLASAGALAQEAHSEEADLYDEIEVYGADDLDDTVVDGLDVTADDQAGVDAPLGREDETAATAPPRAPIAPTRTPLPGELATPEERARAEAGEPPSDAEWERAAEESLTAWGGAARTVQLSALDPEAVRALQAQLKEQGFYRGEVDGLVGKQTRRALSRYYDEQARLASRGRVVPPPVDERAATREEVQHVSGRDEPERAPAGGTDSPARQPATDREPTPSTTEADRIHAEPEYQAPDTDPDRKTPAEE